jgi:hypothetical protein
VDEERQSNVKPTKEVSVEAPKMEIREAPPKNQTNKKRKKKK